MTKWVPRPTGEERERQPIISIIIPTLQEETTLERTLTALRELNPTSYEIIVSDGHSKDRTLEIAHKYADQVIQHDRKTRQNIAQGRNAGAAAAHGEFLAFLDADTYIDHPDAFFTEALRHFYNDPRLLGLTANVKVAPDKSTFADELIFGVLNVSLRVKNGLLRMGDSTGEFQMIRKAAFDSVHGFREDLVTREDADMFLRLSRIGKTTLCSQLTVLHSGRRAHRIGWPRLLWIWTINTIWVALFDRSISKEWPVVR